MYVWGRVLYIFESLYFWWLARSQKNHNTKKKDEPGVSRPA